jgi:DNA-binding CsgD family transcriptional regulator
MRLHKDGATPREHGLRPYDSQLGLAPGISLGFSAAEEEDCGVPIGRDAECARLESAVSAARGGNGEAIVLVGDPGIGKTTLLRWAVARADGMTVVQAHGIESEAELPYAALVDVLGPIVHRLDALPDGQADVLASALGLRPLGAVDRLAVNVATLALLTMAAQDAPLLVVVDDLQWIDAASRDALAFAARRLSSLPVVVLAAQRGGAVGSVLELPGAETLLVGPLAARDAARVLARSGAIAAEVTAGLLDAARGNPLALVELPHLLTAGQLAGIERLVEPLPTANGLERAFVARLAPLSDPARRATVVAAADGSGTAGFVLDALRRLGIEEGVLDEVETLGLIRIEGNTVAFRHPLVRSAAYYSAGASERRFAHAALAETDDDPDRGAWHLAAAALGPDEAVAAKLDLAAERALVRGAFGPAAAALERAASLTPEREVRGTRLVRAARAIEETGALARSEVVARDAGDLIDDPLVRARLVTFIASLRNTAGEVESSYLILLDGAEEVARLDPTWAAAMLCLAANLPLHRLDATAIVELTERAWALGDSARPRVLVERAAHALGKVLAGASDGRSLVLELADEVPTGVLTVGHRNSAVVAWPLVWVEEYGAARAVLTWAVEVQRGGGALRHLPQSLHALAELDFRVGRWVPALANAHEAIALFEETRVPAERGHACATLARIEAALGRDDECRAHAREAFDADTASGLLMATAYAGAALGLLELGRGNPADAIVALEPVERILRDGEIGEPWIVHAVPDLIEAYVRADETARASATLDMFETQAEATGRISARAAAARCRGMLTIGPAFEESFRDALALHAQVPTPFEHGRTELAYGERLRRAGRRTEARERLRSALQTFDRLGAEPWSERARVELRASGQTVRAGEQRTIDMLTPQELQVAALVADGATNRETAAALFLSVKTIEFHLGHVYEKLGIRSRTQLARVFETSI